MRGLGELGWERQKDLQEEDFSLGLTVSPARECIGKEVGRRRALSK